MLRPGTRPRGKFAFRLLTLSHSSPRADLPALTIIQLVDHLSLSMTCRYFFKAYDDEEVWRGLYLARGPVRTYPFVIQHTGCTSIC